MLLFLLYTFGRGYFNHRHITKPWVVVFPFFFRLHFWIMRRIPAKSAFAVSFFSHFRSRLCVFAGTLCAKGIIFYCDYHYTMMMATSKKERERERQRERKTQKKQKCNGVNENSNSI
jgi:hypothetical protein